MGKRLAFLGVISLWATIATGLKLIETCENCSNTTPEWTAMEDCYRTCDGVPKTCYLQFHIERYTVLSGACRDCDNGTIEDCYLPQCITADGYVRSIITVNRRLPGPPIEVCKNDKVVVDVINQMPDESTTIHWHGIRQNGSQYYDGVPYLTQCPILPGNTFRYIFIAEDPGSYFYHSHTGAQKLDGLTGPLIVRDVKTNDVQGKLYDEDLSEHIMFIQDWTRVPGEHLIPGLHLEDISQRPTAFLINGKGTHFDNKLTLPKAEFVVEKGKRYRFRLIGSTCMTCAVAIKFEGHPIDVISADGGLNFAPVRANSVVMNPADRFDVVLTADQPEGIYHITLESVGPGCQETQSGVLKYKGSSGVRSDEPVFNKDFGVMFNDLSSDCDGSLDSKICINDLKGFTNAPKIDEYDNYEQIIMSLGFYPMSPDYVFKEGTYTAYDEPVRTIFGKPFINKISFAFPPSPVLSQYNDIPASAYCSEDCKKGNVTMFCSCTNIYDVKLNSVLDLILIGEDDIFAHPFHVHGYNYYIMEMGKFKDTQNGLIDLKERLRNDKIDTTLRPMRDTISIPFGGYAAIRLVADNPGYWIVHCHFAFHLEGGMAAVIKTGDLKDVPPTPQGFPTCGSYLPPV